jgi:PadR family transcriptional regulator PadR
MANTEIQQLKRGTLEMIFLALIEKQSLYGSEIMSILNNEGAPYFSGAREGTVYPVLYRLEDANLIESVPNGNQKINFRITEEGMARLKTMKTSWGDFIHSVDYFLSREVTQK